MKKLLQRPYHILLIIAGLTFIGSFIDLRILDIHLHDTYFVIDQQYIYWAYCLFLLFIWAIYQVCHRYLLTSWITWIHIVCLIIFLCGIIFAIDYVDFSSIKSYCLFLFLVIVNIFALPVNLLGGMIRKLFIR